MELNSILLQNAQGSGISSIFLIVALFAIFYFFLTFLLGTNHKEIEDCKQGDNHDD